MKITYFTKFIPFGGTAYDVKDRLSWGESGKQELFDLLGSPSSEIIAAMNLMDPKSEQYNPKVEGYLYFLPVVIKYDLDETVEISDFEPGLDVPAQVKRGEAFRAEDRTLFDDKSEFDRSKLTYCIDGGAEAEVSDWECDVLGTKVVQLFDFVCRVKYTLTVWNKSGDSKQLVKYVDVVDDRDISAEAELTLPEYTYEGHTEVARDESVFTVNGKNYSAERAYAEDLGSNSFKAGSAAVSIQRLNATKANATFSKRGNYDVTLQVRTTTGARSTDTESVTVRKTPYIEDSLTGFQKQNRKQVLIAKVALYPGKPLTNYSVTLKDKKTGGSVILTPEDLQENNSTIKTRSMTIAQDVEKGFAYITVEFLTKTPSYFSTGNSTQDFYYEIDVTDSKGDRDSASKSFTVSPDLPPAAAISMETAFLRNEGTNVATIKAEDATMAADGDSVERTWSYGATTTPAVFADVSTLDGYQELSFGTDKIVGFDRTGVGPLTVKLFVKEKWTEPTMEEYVTDAEHLTGSTLSYTEVQNVAPVVSLDLLKGTDQEILLLANNDSEYQTLINGKTALQQELLKNQIDGQIIIKKLMGSSPSDVTGLSPKISNTYTAPIWNGHAMQDEIEYSAVTADSEKTYIATWTWTDNNPFAPITIHAINPFFGDVWTYTTMDRERFKFGNDDTGKYLYVIYNSSNKTVLLDKRTGAVAGSIGMALSDQVWLSDSMIFMIDNYNNLYGVNQSSLAKTFIASNVEAVSRVGGKLQYITKTNSSVVRNTLDMDTLDATAQMIVPVKHGASTPDNYNAVCIDSAGKVILFKRAGTGTDPFDGVLVYGADNNLVKQIACPTSTDKDVKVRFDATVDEKGICNHILVWESDRSTKPDSQYLRGINLNTGAVGGWSRKTDGFGTFAFSAMFETGGKSYFYYNGWYVSNAPDYCGSASVVTFDGASLSLASSVNGIKTYDENIKASDRMLAALWGDNTNGKLDLRITSFPKTLTQETSEIISRFTDKLTFVGNVSTKASEIIEKANAAKPVTKITAAQNGYLTLYNQSLEENKKYYYEYDIKPLTGGTENSMDGLKSSTATMASGQTFSGNTYYVKNTYKEDFQDGNTNNFFTIGRGIWSEYGAFGAYYSGKDNNTNDTPITFDVPSGCVAVLSFDYDIYYLASDHLESAVYVDGERFYTDAAPDARVTGETTYTKVWNHYTHFKLLYPGPHTISCHRYTRNNTASTFIDNLKVEVLSPTQHFLSASHNTQTDKDGWIGIDGVFETPNGNISYGSQASSYYSGGIPGGVTDYFSPKKYGTMYPSRGEYYQTVPSGYLQKGWCSPYGSCAHDDTIEFSIAGYSYKIGEEGTISSGTKVYLRTKPEGTYTHSYKNDARGNSSWINQWDIITFPNNSQTITDNISFNSSFTEYFFPKESSTGITNLSIYFPKGEYLFKNFKVYYYENGRKVYLQNEDCQELTDLSKWTLSTGLSVSIAAQAEEKPDDEYVKVYKKGEKVLYNIFYSDYEKDPSKAGYWVYEHLNWPPDTVHPDAGKTLTTPIDRFYLSGKYTVTHWEADNTQRSGTVGDSSGYDKESNKVTMTFYVDGEGKAPWITRIKTDPQKVKINSNYEVAVGVDDAEKDELQLETEVYRGGRLIFSDRKRGITADPDGTYPEQRIVGLPAATTGVYQIVCTVSDYSGTGIKAYKFTVVSEGSVDGFVSHTPQWEENRKKYNLDRFSDEINREMQIGDYVAMAVPRMRGLNVFWSGERFVLRAETEGEPKRVRVELLAQEQGGITQSTEYSAVLSKTGRMNAAGKELWEGNLWSESMINRWGSDVPVELTFRFVSEFSDGTEKTCSKTAIVDHSTDYWQLHRLW